MFVWADQEEYHNLGLDFENNQTYTLNVVYKEVFNDIDGGRCVVLKRLLWGTVRVVSFSCHLHYSSSAPYCMH